MWFCDVWCPGEKNFNEIWCFGENFFLDCFCETGCIQSKYRYQMLPFFIYGCNMENKNKIDIYQNNLLKRLQNLQYIAKTIICFVNTRFRTMFGIDKHFRGNVNPFNVINIHYRNSTINVQLIFIFIEILDTFFNIWFFAR